MFTGTFLENRRIDIIILSTYIATHQPSDVYDSGPLVKSFNPINCLNEILSMLYEKMFPQQVKNI